MKELLGIEDFSVAVVEPEFPINLGYMARAMANFGMKRLILVSKKKMLRQDADEAAKFASHGSHIIDSMQCIGSVSDLRKRFQLIIGTTAIRGRRKSNITRKTMSAEGCAKAVSLHPTRWRNQCFLFGRDTTGLTNSELQQCDYALTVSTGTEYNTLNISHAAAIVFYIFTRFLSKKGIRKDKESSTRAERERIISLFDELAVLSDFQRFKRGRLSESLRRLLARSSPSLRELYLLMGIANKARTKIRTLESKRRNTR